MLWVNLRPTKLDGTISHYLTVLDVHVLLSNFCFQDDKCLKSCSSIFLTYPLHVCKMISLLIYQNVCFNVMQYRCVPELYLHTSRRHLTTTFHLRYFGTKTAFCFRRLHPFDSLYTPSFLSTVQVFPCNFIHICSSFVFSVVCLGYPLPLLC